MGEVSQEEEQDMKVEFKASLEARLVTEDNLESVAEWCGGQVKGTKLPASERVVQWRNWSAGGDESAAPGSWIVRAGKRFLAYDQVGFDLDLRESRSQGEESLR